MAEHMHIGQHFRWKTAATSGTGEVVSIKNDRQEGMSPEVEDYTELWLTARALGGAKAGQEFTVTLGSDGKSYIDGEQVQLEPLA